MHAFDYRRADDVDAVTNRSPGTALLAGGQGLLPELKSRTRRVPALLDVKALLPGDIAVGDAHVRIGAGATHADIAADSGLQEALPVLPALAAHVGDPSVRHRGTLGGALAQNHPASDWVAAALALDAVLDTDLRQVELVDFLGELRRGAAPRDLIEHVTLRRPTNAAYLKLLHPAQRFPVAGAFVAVNGGRHALALTGLSKAGAFRWSSAEAALYAVEQLPVLAMPEQPHADHFASARYRVHAATVLARRALGRLTDGADGPVSIVHGQPTLESD